MTDDTKLHDIQQRVEQASARNARRLSAKASEARDNVSAFVGEHPFTAVAGGIAMGVLIGAILPKRRANAEVKSKTKAKVHPWVGLAAEAALAIVQRSWDSAQTAGRAGQRSLEDLGDRVSDGTAGLRKGIGRFAEEAAQNVRSASQQASQQAKSVTDKIGSHLRH